MTSRATHLMPEMSTVSEPEKTGGIVDPTEKEIATVAYQLWIDSSCPIGSDRQNWFRAEAMLRNAPVVKREDLSILPSIPRSSGTESEMAAEFTSGRWEGHWEIWEREWAVARWVWDLPSLNVRMDPAHLGEVHTNRFIERG
jgi:hypothetical protein